MATRSQSRWQQRIGSCLWYNCSKKESSTEIPTPQMERDSCLPKLALCVHPHAAGSPAWIAEAQHSGAAPLLANISVSNTLGMCNGGVGKRCPKEMPQSILQKGQRGRVRHCLKHTPQTHQVFSRRFQGGRKRGGEVLRIKDRSILF